MNELGYKKTNGESFTGTGIDNILRNERYTGTYVFHYGKKARDYDPEKHVIKVEGGMPQIISRETFDAVQQTLKQRAKDPNHILENYLLSGKIVCGKCGKNYSGGRQLKGGKYYQYYKCAFQRTDKNGRKLTKEERCRNNTVQRDKIEKYVIRQVSKIITNESAVDKVLDEYNRFAAEVKHNASLIEKYESQAADIEKQIENVANTIAAGYFNQALQDKLNDLDTQKKKIADIITQEKKNVAYLPATKDELRRVYKKAQVQLLNGSFDEQKAVLNLFVNKIVIFGKSVEIYVNLLPMSHLAGIDLSIASDDYLSQISSNTPETSENMAKTIEKDGIDPSFSYPFSGSTNNSLLYNEPISILHNDSKPTIESQHNFDRQKQFAWFDGKVYVPRRAHKGQLLSRKERLWLFMTVRAEIEKRMMLHLEFVKHSSM